MRIVETRSVTNKWQFWPSWWRAISSNRILRWNYNIFFFV